MNVAFYLAIARLDLGTVVAIEFVGPVAVAAIGLAPPRATSPASRCCSPASAC